MDILKQYIIPWKGLGDGSHCFDFTVKDSFFDAFESSEIKGGILDVSVEVEKSATMLQVYADIEGDVVVECDRCLGDVTIPVEYYGDLQVKFSDEIDEYDGDILWMNPANCELDLAQYIYESIALNLPYQRVHGEDDNGESLCDKDMTARFKTISQEEYEAIEEDTRTLGETPESQKLQELKRKLEQENK